MPPPLSIYMYLFLSYIYSDIPLDFSSTLLSNSPFRIRFRRDCERDNPELVSFNDKAFLSDVLSLSDRSLSILSLRR